MPTKIEIVQDIVLAPKKTMFANSDMFCIPSRENKMVLNVAICVGSL
jgi:hypothetical protein